MRTFSRTTQFKKDVKLAGKRGKDLEKLKAVLDLLIAGDELPAQYKDHPLRGNFAGSRDCHIEPDWLLIYTLTENGEPCPAGTHRHAQRFIPLTNQRFKIGPRRRRGGRRFWPQVNHTTVTVCAIVKWKP